MAFVLTGLLGYLLGTIVGGPLVASLRGIRLRESGSGNIGATNALRTGGVRMALPVLLIDVLKGVVAVTLLPLWLGAFADPQRLAFVAGVAAAIGHCYPVWMGFHGGKGVATLAGVFAVLLPGVFALLLAAFVLVVLTTGYVGAASMLAACAAVVVVLVAPATALPTGSLPFVLAMAALVLFKHRDNLKRLRNGTETRMERLALIRQWMRKRQS
ncbi:glycerol-3-phosphate 1-O-acyltransferase PlsY [Algiphilus sp.]|uniref:glycerol-3-phosphate 1-O-acyltransferase PlsY n=1 Tax=Algiphilus sp. TaxID=1872431 RepID=UPI003B51F8F3